METKSFKDEILYRVGCVCGEHSHDITLDFNLETYALNSSSEYKQLTLSIDFPVISCTFEKSFWKRLKWKINKIFDIVFKGSTDGEISILFEGDNYSALKEAIILAENRLLETK